MRRTFVALAVAVAALVLTPGAAAASPSAPDRDCGTIRLTGSLPKPSAGTSVRQSVTIGPDCRVVTGPVTVAPAARAAAAAPFHTYSEMYDCCGIVMSALYTDSTATTAGGQVTSSSTTWSTHVNREPWNAGWSVSTASSSGGCAGACPTATYNHHAEFSYQGVFDPTGDWYYNVHDSKVVLSGNGTARCEQSVTLRHSFIGWNWVHGC
ncbi:hypothetical protein JIG36_35910 [Actinoplanes sp. LDG1-06]|uniref:Secreted protein n=1 Tax=Paractinoplanes ovalisporus TaxID=2810368 RepID=A0ABS2ANT5_9ACTN|nr:hypothetical protein [Actinoplanes ovalisporus]MBM2620901.1 hypothetical protein [Actinoplanes ovalisporus]